MAYVTTIEVFGITPRNIALSLMKWAWSCDQNQGSDLHPTAPIEGGYRITEVWDHREGFEAFMRARLAPAAEAIGLN